MNITEANKLASEFKNRIKMSSNEIREIQKILRTDYNNFDIKVDVVSDRVRSYLNYLHLFVDDYKVDDEMLLENVRYMIVKYPEHFGNNTSMNNNISEWINQVLLTNIDAKFREALIKSIDNKLNNNVKPTKKEIANKVTEGKLGNYKVYTRKINGDTCDWCKSLAGTTTVYGYKTMTYDDNGNLIKTGFAYDYDAIDLGFFKRHSGCDCTIDVKYYKEK